MKLITLETYPGRNYEVLEMVKGTVVESKNIGRDFMAGMKTIVGGEIAGYTEMMDDARRVAVERMIKEAEALGADAIIGLRFGSSAIMQGAAEMLAYGTAIKFID
ncbi:MAG: heavy metal-binding domain-containing protein [Eubacteriales bacterium]|nr:heavy metal-binding domain-containing protein [Eubacteriales bacterium]